MCFVSQQSKRKIFDYKAYIEGRLKGKYVVIYRYADEQPEETPQDITPETPAPTPDNNAEISVDISEDSDALQVLDVFKNTDNKVVQATCAGIFWIRTVDDTILLCDNYPRSIYQSTFVRKTRPHCRGAPHYFLKV